MQITLDGQQIDVEPQAAVGLGLRCRVPSGPGRLEATVFVLIEQATDKAAFWAAWERLGGQGQGLVWESGEAYQPQATAVSERPKSRWRWLRPVRYALIRLVGWIDRLLGGDVAESQNSIAGRMVKELANVSMSIKWQRASAAYGGMAVQAIVTVGFASLGLFSIGQQLTAAAFLLAMSAYCHHRSRKGM